MEDLCSRMEEDVWGYLDRIDKMGGSVSAIERGFFQSEIRQNAYRLKKEADAGERILVGVNKYVDPDEVQPSLLRIDDSVGEQQRKALAGLRDSRDATAAESALSALASAADTDANLMPHIIRAARARATTGEISNTLRGVFGEYTPREVF
jgi:methylmalonyl-CoA mutase N-terminal domain/subunit